MKKQKQNVVKEIFLYWLPIVIWCSIIFGLSSVPNLQIESWGWKDFILRKIAHMVEYGGLSILVMRLAHKRKLKTPWIIGMIVALFYAMSDEYHQTFVVGRTGSIIDVAIDTIGIIIGTTGYYFHRRRKR